MPTEPVTTGRAHAPTSPSTSATGAAAQSRQAPSDVAIAPIDKIGLTPEVAARALVEALFGGACRYGSDIVKKYKSYSEAASEEELIKRGQALRDSVKSFVNFKVGKKKALVKKSAIKWGLIAGTSVTAIALAFVALNYVLLRSALKKSIAASAQQSPGAQGALPGGNSPYAPPPAYGSPPNGNNSQYA